MGGVFPALQGVWRIPPAGANAIGKAWEKKIARTEPSPAAVRFVGALPSLAAWGITLLVFMPRITTTLRYLRNRGRGVAEPVDVFHPEQVRDEAPVVDVYSPPQAPVDEQPPDGTPQSAAARWLAQEGYAPDGSEPTSPAPAPGGGSSRGLIGGGYVMERAGEYATIDGSQA